MSVNRGPLIGGDGHCVCSTRLGLVACGANRSFVRALLRVVVGAGPREGEIVSARKDDDLGAHITADTSQAGPTDVSPPPVWAPRPVGIRYP